jgi:hypothetical protein
LSSIPRFLLPLLLITVLFAYCKSPYKTSSSTIPSKEAQKKEAIDRKALKEQIKKQKEKREVLDQLEHKERTPTRKYKPKKGTPKSPETYY